MDEKHVIAIDGPSGAGKSSVSKRVGAKLGYLHVDSGALYRIMTWQCLENGVDTIEHGATPDEHIIELFRAAKSKAFTFNQNCRHKKNHSFDD